MIRLPKMAALACAAGIALGASSANAETIDFNNLLHGEIVTNQYFLSHGLTISGVNYDGPDAVVAFDSNRTGTPDPDLQGKNWSTGNIASGTDMGKMLILPENVKDLNNNGRVDVPDDEGSRPAGYFTFTWDAPISLFGVSVIDIEGVTERTPGGHLIDFYMDLVKVGSVGFDDLLDNSSSFYDATIKFGDHSANTISPITASAIGATQFNRVVLHMGGSGAVDNLVFEKFTTIPEPASLGLLGMGAMMLVCRPRRRHEAA